MGLLLENWLFLLNLISIPELHPEFGLSNSTLHGVDTINDLLQLGTVWLKLLTLMSVKLIVLKMVLFANDLKSVDTQLFCCSKKELEALQLNTLVLVISQHLPLGLLLKLERLPQLPQLLLLLLMLLMLVLKLSLWDLITLKNLSLERMFSLNSTLHGVDTAKRWHQHGLNLLVLLNTPLLMSIVPFTKIWQPN